MIRPLTEPNVETLGMWEFITTTDHADDALMDEYEKHLCDPSVYLKVNWKQQYVDNQAQLIELRKRHELGVLMRRGIPDWLGNQSRARIWPIVANLDDINRSPAPQTLNEIYPRVFGPHVPRRCARIPTFGGYYRPDQYPMLTKVDVDSATRLLVALALENTDIPFAPQLPDFVLRLLCFLPEAQVLEIASDRLRRSSTNKDRARFLFTTPRDADASIASFMDVLHHCLPAIHTHLQLLQIGASDFVDLWLKRLFVGVLRDDVALRVFDAYLGEGMTILYMVGVGLLHAIREPLLRCQHPDQFLNCLRSMARKFDNAELLMQNAYSCRATRSLLQRLRVKHSRAFDHPPASSHTHVQTSPPSTPARSISSSSTSLRSSKPNSTSSLSTTCSNINFSRPKILQPSSIISQEQMEIIWSWLPEHNRMTNPKKLFSTQDDGCSLTNLYARCDPDVEPTLLFIKTEGGHSFGAFVSYGWDSSESGFYGSGESFVFRMNPKPTVYRWSPGQGELFQCAGKDHIAVGGSAIWLDDELWSGRSEPGNTFNNQCLLGDDRKIGQYAFQCVTLEVYTVSDED
eukprot:CAMPEP_0168596328 /NCGR_PEP_ID=MMETSP0420-20121227/9963_1 /TAXON_ID=498008 /ORGANISM="Pessonella sp." /LENGTH=572 /DNA_ID=CAMNT_0008632887 /DNA_START=193 /DNA_END=1911 /DNA_ORIENTATION=+